MNKTILLAGKNGEDAGHFADGLQLTSRLVAVTGKLAMNAPAAKKTVAERKADLVAFDEEKSRQAETGICSFEWNKGSSLSARNIVLETENYFGALDEAVLYFDEEFFSSKTGVLDAEEIARSTDEYVLGYEYLTSELLSYYEKKYRGVPRTLVFLLRECPTACDVLHSPSLKNGKTAVASPTVAAAASAFTAFAENIAAVYGSEPYVQIILVRGDSTMEEARREETLAKWLCSYMETVKADEKYSAKKACQWVKPGARKAGSGVFGLFRK